MLKKEWKRPELEVLDVSMTMSNGKGHNNGNNNGNNNNGNAPGHGYDSGNGPGKVLPKVMVLLHFWQLIEEKGLYTRMTV